MLNAARAGAITGGLYGVGSGETPTERAIGGVTGTAVGGALGGVASPVADVAGFGVNKALLGGSKIYNWLRAEFDPAYVGQEAERRVGQAITQDQLARPATLADLEAAAAGHAAGIPRIAADEGGELTTALARSAANQSPEAREALTEAARDRFAGQAQRGAQFIRNLTGGVDATTTQEGLEAAARAANKPAYAKAYSEGSGGVWHEGLEQLLQSPDVRAAARDAATTGANKAAAQGFKPPRNPFVWDENGAYTLATDTNGNRAIPSLQFWDAVKQNLDDKIGAARRAGEKGHAADLTALNAQLKAHLDAAVPSYADARAGAAAFFGAQDALEAGQKFVTARGENAQYARGIARMSDPRNSCLPAGMRANWRTAF